MKKKDWKLRALKAEAESDRLFQCLEYQGTAYQDRWRMEVDSLMRINEDLIEAIRLTQEYILLPAKEGWTWYDTLKKYRPDLAAYFRELWEKRDETGPNINEREKVLTDFLSEHYPKEAAAYLPHGPVYTAIRILRAHKNCQANGPQSTVVVRGGSPDEIKRIIDEALLIDRDLDEERADTQASSPVVHDHLMPHDFRYAPDDPRHCPPNCPAVTGTCTCGMPESIGDHRADGPCLVKETEVPPNTHCPECGFAVPTHNRGCSRAIVSPKKWPPDLETKDADQAQDVEEPCTTDTYPT